MKQRYVALFAVLLSSIIGCYFYYNRESLSAQFNKHIMDAIHLPASNAFFEQADAYKYAQDYRRALAAFEKLLPQSKTAADSLYAYNQLAYIALAMNDDSTAAQYIRDIEAHFPLVDKSTPSVAGDYFYNRGVLAYRVFHPKEAESLLKRALGLYEKVYGGEHLKIAQCLSAMGVLHYEYTHTPDSAFLYSQMAFAIFKNNKEIIKDWSGECLLGMSKISRSKRQYDEAAGYCDEALNILNKKPFINNVLIAQCLVEKARAINMRRFKASKIEDKKRINCEVESYFQQAIDICPKNSIRLQECYQLWTRHYSRLDSLSDPDFQKKFWSKLSDLQKVIQTQGIQKLSLSDYLIGSFYDNLNQVDSAVTYLSKFAKSYQKDSLHSRTTLSETYAALAYNYDLLANQNKNTSLLDSALLCFKMNLLNYANDSDLTKSWETITQPEFYEKVSFQFAPLSGVSRLLLKKYKISGDRKSLALTLKIGKLIDELLFAGITSQDDDAYDFFQFDAAESTYNTAIKASAIYYQLTKEKRFLDDVFRFGERVRSFLLYRDIEVQDTSIATPPQYLRDKIRKLESEINELKWATEQGQDVNIALMQKQSLREQLYKEVKEKFPNYYRLKVVQPIPNLQKVQEQLQDNQCFIQYTFSDSLLHVLFIRKNGEYLFQTRWDTSWQNKIYKLCSYMNGESKEANINAQTFGNLSFDVYKKLFPIDSNQYQKLMRDCNEYIIAPDRQLNVLPFEALVESIPTIESRFQNLTYLVKRISIGYTPSWKIYETNHKILLPNQPTLCAYTYGFDSNELQSAKTEFDNLRYIFTNKPHFAIGKEATSKYFMADTIQPYDILHLSLHAKSDPLSKYNNTIYFGPHRSDSINGFNLLNRRFKEKLVVLSACQSAYGKITKGEGTYALSRIFLRAGVPHVVASLWSISDVSTEKITTRFYENIVNKHLSPMQALNQAKQTYIKLSDELTGHPRLWAGLVCVD